MFRGAKLFNQPLNTWKISNVTDMSFMFENAGLFNQPLNNWDVSNVTNMYAMFDNTTIGEMLKKHNLTEKQFFESPTNKKLYIYIYEY
tara:strand:+ start:152 stop:415 length:264 start_codon:yes stop_codon:yes gene_type:complete